MTQASVLWSQETQAESGEEAGAGMEGHSEGILKIVNTDRSFPGGSAVKTPPVSVGDVGLLPGSGRSPGGGNGN